MICWLQKPGCFGLHEREEVWEVINHVRALNLGLERLQDLPLSMRLVREIHGELIRGVRGSQYRPGEFRTSQNWIGPAGCTIEEAVFVPPPPHEMRTALGDLEKFWHSDADLPILIRVRVGACSVRKQFTRSWMATAVSGRLLITFFTHRLQNPAQNPPFFFLHFSSSTEPNTTKRLQAVRGQRRLGEMGDILSSGSIGGQQPSLDGGSEDRSPCRESHRPCRPPTDSGGRPPTRCAYWNCYSESRSSASTR